MDASTSVGKASSDTDISHILPPPAPVVFPLTYCTVGESNMYWDGVRALPDTGIGASVISLSSTFTAIAGPCVCSSTGEAVTSTVVLVDVTDNLGFSVVAVEDATSTDSTRNVANPGFVTVTL